MLLNLFNGDENISLGINCSFSNNMSWSSTNLWTNAHNSNIYNMPHGLSQNNKSSKYNFFFTTVDMTYYNW